ncbi:MAG: A24 family peptidase [Gammaproteobacteria bacterium]
MNIDTAEPTTIIPFLALAIVLATAVYTDLRNRRIPNLLTAAAALIGFGFQIWNFGLEGVVNASSGLCAGLIALIPIYWLGGMGAGDVKLMAAVGAFLGFKLAAIAAALTLVTGALFGLVILSWRGGFQSMARRYLGTFRFLLATGHLSHRGPQAGEAAAVRFPYALAIALGTGWTLIWQGL